MNEQSATAMIGKCEKSVNMDLLRSRVCRAKDAGRPPRRLRLVVEVIDVVLVEPCVVGPEVCK